MTLRSRKILLIFRRSRPLFTKRILRNLGGGFDVVILGNSLNKAKSTIVFKRYQSKLRKCKIKASSKTVFKLETDICTKAFNNSCRPLFLAIVRISSKVRKSRFRRLKFLFLRLPCDLYFRFLLSFIENALKEE